MIPSKPLYFASSFELGGVAQPLLVRSYEGRPIKIEGNPRHPGCNGASGIKAQATLLELYDPDRSQGVAQYGGQARKGSTFEAFEKALGEARAKVAGGNGLRVLAPRTASPSLADMRDRLLKKFPSAKWVEWEPVNDDNSRAGSKLAFGKPYRALFALKKAKIVLTIDADLFGQHANGIAHAGEFAETRNPESGHMSRLYSFESHVTETGTTADHRVALRASQMVALVAALDAALAGKGAAVAGAPQPKPAAKFLTDEKIAKVFAALVDDLVKNQGASVVVAGDHLPAPVHALVHRLNAVLGNVGKTVSYIEQPEGPTVVAGLQGLTKEMLSGAVKALLIIGGNPVYDAPADVGFAAALAKVEMSVHASLYEDETSRRTSWHVPLAHFLESWGDTRSYDGTVSLIQPLIAPLYGGKSGIELVAMLIGDATRQGLEILKRTHQDTLAGEPLWRRAIHDGFIDGTAAPRKEPTLAAGAPTPMPPEALTGVEGTDALELVFHPDPKLYDGRFANNGWLMECPDPITKLTWDNVALVSPATAKKLGITDRTVVKLTVDGKSLELPVMVAPGHAQGSLSVTLGYGRQFAGHVGGLEGSVDPVGSSTYRLRSAKAYDIAQGAQVSKISEGYQLATLQDKHTIDEIGMHGLQQRMPALIRESTLENFKKHPDFAKHVVHHPPNVSLWKPPVSYDGYRWGMTIDLGKCTGCNSCIVACQSENNIPVAGKSRVLMGRELHWMSVHRYYKGDENDPELLMQPVTCPAVREGTVRASVSRGRNHAHPRGPERHGLQPLHRHPVLLEQLPVQGSALQLLQLSHGFEEAGEQGQEDGLQPGSDRSLPRRHGEVHVLRSAHPGGQDSGQERPDVKLRTVKSSRPASRRARPKPSLSAI